MGPQSTKKNVRWNFVGFEKNGKIENYFPTKSKELHNIYTFICKCINSAKLKEKPGIPISSLDLFEYISVVKI